VSNNVLGTKFKLIMGYKGSNASMLAMERGEVEGHATSWTALKVAHPTWRPEKKISILAQFALKRHPELQEVPTIVELARNDEERQILSAVMNASEIGTAYFTSPGVPADRVEALRRAFDATMKDQEFLADAAKLRLGINPIPGEELQKLVVDVSKMPPALLEKVRAAYKVKK
jgi:tripartite-type tricarboxylate transporter receptor subunit TctC